MSYSDIAQVARKHSRPILRSPLMAKSPAVVYTSKVREYVDTVALS